MLTAATLVPDEMGVEQLGFVAHNCVMLYPYYIRSPRVLIEPILDPAQLRAFLAQPDLPPSSYLWQRLEAPGRERWAAATSSPALETFLAQFPRTRVPRLENSWGSPGPDRRVRVTEAWLYRLK